MHQISVTPAASGWMVEADVLAAPQLFLKGGRAEEAAKRLGEGLARAGRWAEIRVRLADGEEVGRFLCIPDRTTPMVADDSVDRDAVTMPQPPQRTAPSFWTKAHIGDEARAMA